MGVSFFMGNARTIAQLICGGICHRFPDLNFVSVESGVGWLPFALGALDWQWKNCGVAIEHPEYELLPTEYFLRQIYGCFWFETETAFSAIEQLGAGQLPLRDGLPPPDEHVPRAGLGGDQPRETSSSRPSAASRRTRRGRSCTTTRHASTGSTEALGAQRHSTKSFIWSRLAPVDGRHGQDVLLHEGSGLAGVTVRERLGDLGVVGGDQLLHPAGVRGDGDLVGDDLAHGLEEQLEHLVVDQGR